MTNQEVLELLNRFECGSLYTMKLSTGSFSLELSRGAGTPSPAPVRPEPQALPDADAAITSPLAGVFYAAAAPDAQPYVRVRDTVSKGQTLCLLEAIKMMNEVPAPCDCVITQVLAEDGALTAYGEPLFRYRLC